MKKLILVVPLQERFNEQILAFTTGHKLATTLYNLKEKGSGNMKLLFFALLIYLRVDVSKGEIISCKRKTMKQGCTKIDDTLFPVQLANNRDASSSVFTGTHLDWGNLPPHLHSLICHCHKAAIEQGFVAIAVIYYGECFGGGDRSKIANFLKDASVRKTTCQDSTYKTCDDKSDLDCTGDDQSQYVYLVTPQYDDYICGSDLPKCDINGRCNLTNLIDPSCSCNQGFFGDGQDCQDVDECLNKTHTCHDNATCTNTKGSFKCRCSDGFSGDGHACNDIDECSSNIHSCHVNATCFNTIGSFQCICNQGYRKCDNRCIDINECENNHTNNCHADSVCVNTEGSYLCQCLEGHQGDGIICGDVDECDDTISNQCHQNSHCTNTKGSYSCQCRTGFQGDGLTCLDMNECVDSKLNNCSENALCVNSVGRFTCVCKNGFTGNGVDCFDIDECLQPYSNDCHRSSTCLNLVGSYQCQCIEGFIGNGTFCEDFDECVQEKTNRCSSNAHCINSIGNYSCQCRNGFTGSGFDCKDIDECSEAKHSCHEDATCTNTVGLYRCICNEGYKGNGTFCEDIDECKESRLPQCYFGRCVNTKGSYACECNPGFKKVAHLCQDIDECSENTNNNCDLNATCLNVVGSYSCLCNQGFRGDGASCQLMVIETFKDSLNKYLDFIVEKVVERFRQEEINTQSANKTAEDSPGKHLSFCGNLTCHQNATCKAMQGYLSKCICDDGFVGNGISSCQFKTLSSYKEVSEESTKNENDDDLVVTSKKQTFDSASDSAVSVIGVSPKKDGCKVEGGWTVIFEWDSFSSGSGYFDSKDDTKSKEGYPLGITALVLSIVTAILVLSLMVVLNKRINLLKTFSNKIYPNKRIKEEARFRSYTKMFRTYFNNNQTDDRMSVIREPTGKDKYRKSTSVWSTATEQSSALDSSINSNNSFTLEVIDP